MRRWKRRGTWARLGVIFACYLLLPALTTAGIGLFSTPDSGMMLFILMLFIAFPLVTIALAAWDGITQGFAVLWIVMPIVFFVVPMLIFFNESALIYGAIYSVLAIVANGVGSLFRPKSHSTSSPRES
ncbi:biotin synthase [Gulosibacter hominis]|uniref:biotin synthase n=1 Tax=Gulosibacter hominis TaxID=2770504 RepID=UPI0019187152|nr:biotin synthase [Gulosibacter hominis]